MTQIDDKALEAAVLAHDKEEAAMRGEPDPWADERPDGEFSDRKAAMALAIRAYLTALSSSPVSGLVERLDTCAVATFPIVQEAATTLTALAAKVAEMEAENARLREALANMIGHAKWAAAEFDVHYAYLAECEAALTTGAAHE